MKTLPYLLAVAAPLLFAVGFVTGKAAKPGESERAQAIINYAAETPTTEEGGEALRRHPVIGAITNILIEPGRLSVYGRNGSRIWYYPETK